MRIYTGNHRSIKTNPYNTTLKLRIQVDKDIDEILDTKVIEI